MMKFFLIVIALSTTLLGAEQDASRSALPPDGDRARSFLAQLFEEGSGISLSATGEATVLAIVRPEQPTETGGIAKVKIVPLGATEQETARFALEGVLSSEVFRVEFVPRHTPPRHEHYSYARDTLFVAGPVTPATMIYHDTQIAKAYTGRLPQNARPGDVWTPLDAISIAFADDAVIWIPFALRNNQMGRQAVENFHLSNVDFANVDSAVQVKERWISEQLLSGGAPISIERVITYSERVAFLPTEAAINFAGRTVAAFRLHWSIADDQLPPDTVSWKNFRLDRVEADSLVYDDGMRSQPVRRFKYNIAAMRHISAEQAAKASTISIPETYRVAVFDAEGQRARADKPEPGIVGTLPPNEQQPRDTDVRVLARAWIVPLIAIGLTILAVAWRRRLASEIRE